MVIIRVMRRLLSAKQERFCQEMARTRDRAQSYAVAYERHDLSREALAKRAFIVLREAVISERIREICDTAQLVAGYNVADVMKMWHDIAFADPNELIGLRVGNCRYCWGDCNEYQWGAREYREAVVAVEKQNVQGVRMLDDKWPVVPLPDCSGGFDWNHTREPNPECPDCRGEGIERVVARDTRKLSRNARLLYGGVKKTRHGLEIILADQNKARENLSRMLGAFQDNVNVHHSMTVMADVADKKTIDVHGASEMYQKMIASPTMRAGSVPALGDADPTIPGAYKVLTASSDSA